MEPNSYTGILKYLQEQNRGVSPQELSVVLQKSRVTIQSNLKRLLKNGWVKKTGVSPRTYYSAVTLLLNPQEILTPTETAIIQKIEDSQPTGLLEAFIYKSNGRK